MNVKQKKVYFTITGAIWLVASVINALVAIIYTNNYDDKTTLVIIYASLSLLCLSLSAFYIYNGIKKKR